MITILLSRFFWNEILAKQKWEGGGGGVAWRGLGGKFGKYWIKLVLSITFWEKVLFIS